MTGRPGPFRRAAAAGAGAGRARVRRRRRAVPPASSTTCWSVVEVQIRDVATRGGRRVLLVPGRAGPARAVAAARRARSSPGPGDPIDAGVVAPGEVRHPLPDRCSPTPSAGRRVPERAAGLSRSPTTASGSWTTGSAVTPAARVFSYVDYWGTRVDSFGIRGPTPRWRSSAEVVGRDPAPTAADRGTPVRGPAHRREFVDAHIEYLQRDRHTEFGAGRGRRGRSASCELAGPDVVGVVLAVHRFVGSTLSYRPGCDRGRHRRSRTCSPAAHGVCQDYAHLAVAMCRSLGIPARYVSGYLFTDDDDGGLRCRCATPWSCRPTPGSKRRSRGGAGWRSTRPTARWWASAT